MGGGPEDKNWLRGLAARIDQEFPCDTLIRWTEEITGGEGRPRLDQGGQERLQRIYHCQEFSIIRALALSEIDTSIRVPSTGE